MNSIFHPTQQTHRGGYRGGLDEQVECVEWPMPEKIPTGEVVEVETEEEGAA